MALAAFSFETSPVAMVEPIEKNTPCANPVMILAITRLLYPGACQASKLPITNNAITDNSTYFLFHFPVNAVNTGAPIATPKA